MSSFSLLLVVLPLLVFILVDTFASLNIALVAAVIVAIGECLFSYFHVGELDTFSVFSIFLVFLMAGLAFTKKSRRIFYLKPAILSFGLGLFLVITYFMNKYVLYEGMTKYGDLFPPEAKAALDHESVQKMMKSASLTVGLATILHGVVATYAALKMNRWWWFVIAGLGAYVFLFAGMIFAAFV